jgi:hypothetical protein
VARSSEDVVTRVAKKFAGVSIFSRVRTSLSRYTSRVMRTVIGGGLSLLLFCTACGHVRGLTWDVQTLPIGAGAPSKPPNCPVRQELLTPKEAQDRYRQVGVLCHVGGWMPMQVDTSSPYVATSSTGSWGDLAAQTVTARPAGMRTLARDPVTLLDDVREDACRLGGEIIVRHGFCGPPRARRLGRQLGMESGVEFGVYEANPPTPIAAD